ncbi:MAG: acetoacetate decarboxylase family protein [Coleofasciculaceae cyanobacterium]
MSYPSAPWTLQGYAIQTLQLIDINQVRPFIPPEFEIISVLPGKTIGGVYLSNYTSGSTLEYSELIIAPGIVNYSGKIGGWISHIYVDNSESVAGGREIWSLPKEFADFTWQKAHQNSSKLENMITVSQGTKTLCQLKYNIPSFSFPIPFSGDVFSTKLDSILLFKGEFSANIGLCSSQLEIPIASPFVSIGLERPFLTCYCKNLRLVAGVPKVAGYREVSLT